MALVANIVKLVAGNLIFVFNKGLFHEVLDVYQVLLIFMKIVQLLFLAMKKHLLLL